MVYGIVYTQAYTHHKFYRKISHEVNKVDTTLFVQYSRVNNSSELYKYCEKCSIVSIAIDSSINEVIPKIYSWYNSSTPHAFVTRRNQYEILIWQ